MATAEIKLGEIGGGGQKVVVSGVLTNSFNGTAQFTIDGITNIEAIVINESYEPTMTGNHGYQSVSTKIDSTTFWGFNNYAYYPSYCVVTDITGNVVSMSTNAATGKLYYKAIGT